MKQTENCYYSEYGECANKLSKFLGKPCGGAEACGHFVSESAYFFGSVSGTLKEGKTPEEIKADKERVAKIFAHEKTKKQLKREARLEAEKNKANGVGSFSLGDDPMFKQLFGEKKS